MKNWRQTMVCILAMLLLTLGMVGSAAGQGRFGIRGGAGTDVSGGVAWGFGGTYLFPAQSNQVEFGIEFFGGSFEEETDEGNNTYVENTDIFVFALNANLLVGYEREELKPFFIAGVGLGSITVEWEESSATDSSLGTPLPGGGSMQSDDGSAGGTILNLGVGQSFGNGFELRLEFPVIVTFSPPGGASSVVPAATLMGGLRF